MSASEKLKALETKRMRYIASADVDLRNALPQIRAVVETAETVDALMIWMLGRNWEQNRSTCEYPRLGPALTALDEALP